MTRWIISQADENDIDEILKIQKRAFQPQAEIYKNYVFKTFLSQLI